MFAIRMCANHKGWCKVTVNIFFPNRKDSERAFAQGPAPLVRVSGVAVYRQEAHSKGSTGLPAPWNETAPGTLLPRGAVFARHLRRPRWTPRCVVLS